LIDEVKSIATQRFKTIVAKTGSRTAIVIPFDPNAVWGIKQILVANFV
jgi:predicted ribonuclease YlaK